MHQTDLLIPAMALIGWTMLVLLLVPYRRFKAAFEKRVSPEDFKVGESANVPEDVSIPNRAYMNLLEGPVLFYAICLIQFVTQWVDIWAIWLAWTYVGLRVIQSLIYLTYNHIFHRLSVFALGNLVLTVMWARLLYVLF